MSTNDVVIRFDNVSKQYFLGSSVGNIRETIVGGFKKVIGKQLETQRQSIWALKDVSFEVTKGESLGLIGPNGSGKTTTLKILSKITRPTSGSIYTKGKIGALIELAAGFHPELTGRENIYLSGAIRGLKKREIDKRFDEIVDFSGLEDFIDTPVKRYSSGMYVRLGFSVAAYMDPDILLIDEILAVGDQSFKIKCIGRIHEFIKKGVSFIIVSHNRHMIENLCQKSVFLYKGEKILEAETSRVFDEYLSGKYPSFEKHDFEKRTKIKKEKKEIEIINIELFDKNFHKRTHFKTGEEAFLKIDFKVNADKFENVLCVGVFREEQLLHGIRMIRGGRKKIYNKGETGYVQIHYKALNLLEGKYHIDFVIQKSQVAGLTLDAFRKAITFYVHSDSSKGASFVYLDHDWELK